MTFKKLGTSSGELGRILFELQTWEHQSKYQPTPPTPENFKQFWHTLGTTRTLLPFSRKISRVMGSDSILISEFCTSKNFSKSKRIEFAKSPKRGGKDDKCNSAINSKVFARE
jgi:hypothetical protein